jgi:coenzyme F420 hydrogenase subunit beta
VINSTNRSLSKKQRNSSVAWVVEANLCMSCGICEAVCPSSAITVEYNTQIGMFYPDVSNEKCCSSGYCVSVCPGHEVDLQLLSSKYTEEKTQDMMIGSWRETFAARSLDKDIVARASSGGVITTAVQYLLMTGQVDGAIVTRLRYGSKIPFGEAFIAYNGHDLLESQGSKYCPIPISRILSEKYLDAGKRYVFVGLPCHIEGLRKLQERDAKFNDIVPFVIGSFCGGFKPYTATEELINKYGMGDGKISQMSYRGGGWPGYLTIKNSKGKRVKEEYPKYGEGTLISKLHRCALCVDGTSELADISFGDAWLSKYKKTGLGWSALITRTIKGERLINELVASGLIHIENLMLNDLLISQEMNLHSKKKRQSARRKLFKLLGYKLPNYGSYGYDMKITSILFEVKVVFVKFILSSAARYEHIKRLLAYIRKFRTS